MTAGERRSRNRWLVWLHAVADPYTYRMTPGEKRRVNAAAMLELEAMATADAQPAEDEPAPRSAPARRPDR